MSDNRAIVEALTLVQDIVRAEHDRLMDEHVALPTSWFGGVTYQHHRHHAAAMACARIHTYLHEEIMRLHGLSPTGKEAGYADRYRDMNTTKLGIRPPP